MGNEQGQSVTVLNAAADAAASPGFLGTFHHQLDVKGRIAVPSQFRRFLPEYSVVSPWAAGILMIWTPAAWDRELRNYRRLAETRDQDWELMGELTGNAALCEIDTQGRLLLQAEHRSWAGITDKAVFRGHGDGIEIFSEEHWLQHSGPLDPERFHRRHNLAWPGVPERDSA